MIRITKTGVKLSRLKRDAIALTSSVGKSHQRSWWFVSYSAYTKETAAPCPESHQRSWWIVHTQPNSPVGFTLRLIKARLGMKNPPTALVGFRTRAQCLLRRPIMNDPPTALVAG